MPNYLEFEKPIAKLEAQVAHLEADQREKSVDCSSEIQKIRDNIVQLQRKRFKNLTAWETVQVARHPDRPLVSDYINTLVKDFRELHGDRRHGDDPAIAAGFGRIGGQRVMLIGHRKGKDTRDKINCYFGCAHPEGYRKALMKMRLAEKFGLPIVCLVDTPGAYPGIGAEERGIAEAIAHNLMQMFRLRTPIVAVVIGEGGSGGALGIGIADRVALLQYSYYSVASPEACSAILWKSAAEVERAAEALQLTAPQLKKAGVIDEVLPEPLGGAHRNPQETARTIEQFIVRSLRTLGRLDIDTLLAQRHEKYARIGRVQEPPSAAAAAPVEKPSTRAKPSRKTAGKKTTKKKRSKSNAKK